MADKINRRQFFKMFSSKASDKPAGNSANYIRPPGAVGPNQEFLSKCTKCGDCKDVCPYNAIKIVGPLGGVNEGTPFMQPEVMPCYLCEDYPCIASCEPEALALHLAELPMAKVELNLDACLNAQGTLCDQCALMCPTKINAIKMVSRMPVLDEDACVGCGLCFKFCGAEPNAFSWKRIDENR